MISYDILSNIFSFLKLEDLYSFNSPLSIITILHLIKKKINKKNEKYEKQNFFYNLFKKLIENDNFYDNYDEKYNDDIIKEKFYEKSYKILIKKYCNSKKGKFLIYYFNENNILNIMNI
jgi:hypothetical protein